MPMRTSNRERERPGRRALATVGVCLLPCLGCLNLDLPTVPPTPPAPYLTVVTPQPGDVVALTAQVTVAAASVNGIGRVTVLCGPDGGQRTAYAWAAPPYIALVDFAPCESVAVPNPDAGPLLLQLAVQAVSDAGALQQSDFQVFLNTQGPALTVQYPPSAQPLAPYTVQVSSTADAGLRSFPEVLLDGQPASSVTVVQDAGVPTYLVYFASAPGLGTDNYPYTPGAAVPIEVLTDTERMVRLTVSATAENGNTTELDLAVDLTRVVWDRYIPGKPASSSPIVWAAEPVAFDGGLVLPLATALPASATSAWIPGVLAQADGTFYGFNTQLLDGGLAGGFLARGLNAQGQTLFFQFTGNGSNLLLAPAPNSTAAVVTATGGPASANAPLSQVDALLCLQDSVTACSDAGTEGLTCYSPELSVVTATSGTVFTGPPNPGVVAGAGGSYLSPNVAVCGSSWNLVDLASGNVSFGPTEAPAGCPVEAIDKLLAVGDGTFVVQLTSNCGVAAPLLVYPILRVGPGSTILGSYLAPLGSPPTVQAELVGVLADGRVVTLSNQPPYTTFSLWALNGATPDVVSPIAGLYDTGDSALASVLAQSTYSGSDGSFAVLVSGAALGVGVLAFAPDLQPRWLYVYPRVTDTFNSRLVSAPSFPNVYLVDEFNEHAVSLQVGAPVPGGVPDAGTDGGPLRAITGMEETIYQLPGQPQQVVYPNFSSTNAAAYVLDGGVYGAAIPAVGFDNGTFTVAGLPTSGNYLLDLAGTYFWLSDNALVVTNLAAGRPNVVQFNYALSSDATLTLNLTNLAPWNVNDEVEVLSLGANDFVNTAPFGCNPAPLPGAGTTTLNGSVFSVKNCGGPNTIQAAEGDRVVIEQMHVQQTANGSAYLSMAALYDAPALSLSDGQNVTLAGAFVPVNQNQTVSCDFKLSQFAAALQGLQPSGYTSSLNWGLNLVGVSFLTSQGWEPRQGTSDILAYSPSPPNVDAVSGAMAYGVPASYPFIPVGILTYDANQAFAFPGTTANNQQTVGMQTIFSLSDFCQNAVVPLLTPVQAITLNGADASKPLTGVGVTPLLAWSPPAIGTPTRYLVLINQFFTSGTQTLSTGVAEIETQDLQVQIPPGLLSAGNTYSVQIVADDTVPIGAGYLAFGQSTGAAVSSVFTP
ncbi:MAG: hypothetical protein ACLPJH_05870 [Myxococcaceae bacterium]